MRQTQANLKLTTINNSVFNKIIICNNTLLLNVAAVYGNFDSPIRGCRCVYTLRNTF